MASFAVALSVCALAVLVSLASSHAARKLPLPGPAVLLVIAAGAAQWVPGASSVFTVTTVQDIASAALILILFDGGLQIGPGAMRRAIGPVAALGVFGTLITAAGMSAAAHYLLGAGWGLACLVGIAIAPTDPAVVFSVLGDKEISGRTGTILEGESGANDPIGIALMVAVISIVTGSGGSPAGALATFAIQMGLGLAGGGLGGIGLVWLVRRTESPRAGMRPLWTLAGAAAIYGLTSMVGGSGFLAVFGAGIVVGGANLTYEAEVLHFHTALASLAEVVVFVSLGITVPLMEIFSHAIWLQGLVLAGVLAIVVRPVATVALLAPTSLHMGERIFVALAGLKGAVPILLATFAISGGAHGAHQLYLWVFVVVLASVVFQGGALAYIAKPLGVPLVHREPDPALRRA